MILYTIGHSTSELADFVRALQDVGVEVLVDVRSKPRSRIAHFDQYPMQEAVEGAGLRYRFLGDRLGGMPQDPKVAAMWQQGKLNPVIIDHLRKTDEWQDGLVELTKLIRANAVCIMCSEADANECHRKAVALDAAAAIPGLEIKHLSVKGQGAAEVGVQEVLL